MKFFNYLLLLLISFNLNATTFDDDLSPIQKTKNNIIFSFAGDLMAHDTTLFKTNHSIMFDAVKEYFLSDDFSFVNYESPIYLKEKEQGYPYFNSHPSYTKWAIKAGLDGFSIVNNHTADQDREGIIDTLKNWQDLKKEYPHIEFSGIKTDPNKWQSTTFTVAGAKVCFVAGAEFLNMNRKDDNSSDLVNLVPFFDTEKVASFIDFLKEKRTECDILIVSYHGGIEYVLKIEKEKNAFYKQLIDLANVDILWGHHPHVLQPLEKYHNAYIINSAGNLISAQAQAVKASEALSSSLAPRADSAIYQFSFVKTKKLLPHQVSKLKKAGKFIKRYNVDNLKVIPISTYYSKENGTIIKLTTKAIKDSSLTATWRNYFKERLNAMKNLYNLVNRDNLVN